MKFCQLIEYNMRNIFLEKLYTKCGRRTILKPFSKKSKTEHLWINILKFSIIFLWFVKLRTIESD